MPGSLKTYIRISFILSSVYKTLLIRGRWLAYVCHRGNDGMNWAGSTGSLQERTVEETPA